MALNPATPRRPVAHVETLHHLFAGFVVGDPGGEKALQRAYSLAANDSCYALTVASGHE
jgi:hypothetical protein